MAIFVIALAAIILLILLLVRIGAVALRLTGLDAETASFQAASAFTGTGFTTTEADLVTKHPSRRRIVKMLMVVGNVYFAAIVAVIISAVVTFWNTPRVTGATLALIAAFLVLVGLVLLFTRSRRFSRWLDHYIERRLSGSGGFRIYQLQRVLDLAGGYTVGELRVPRGSWLAGRSLQDLALGRYKVLVLAIERGLRLVRTPTAATVVEENDNLICYGPVEVLGTLLDNPPAAEEAPGPVAATPAPPANPAP